MIRIISTHFGIVKHIEKSLDTCLFDSLFRERSRHSFNQIQPWWRLSVKLEDCTGKQSSWASGPEYFFFNFWRTHVLFVEPLIPLFWTSGDVCPGFQSQGGVTCTLSCLCTIPYIHLWCDTCWPLDSHHGGPSHSLHVDLCRGRMPGFERVIFWRAWILILKSCQWRIQDFPERGSQS